VKRYAQRRVVETERRIVDGTPARVETLRRRSQGSGVINTAYSERLNATFRERLAPLSGAGASHPDAARGHVLGRHGVTLHIERRGFLHFMWRYRMEVHGSLSQLTLPKMNAEVSVRA